MSIKLSKAAGKIRRVYNNKYQGAGGDELRRKEKNQGENKQEARSFPSSSSSWCLTILWSELKPLSQEALPSSSRSEDLSSPEAHSTCTFASRRCHNICKLMLVLMSNSRSVSLSYLPEGRTGFIFASPVSPAPRMKLPSMTDHYTHILGHLSYSRHSSGF